MDTNCLLKWCEIDLAKLKNNIIGIKSILPENTKILAVLKDDAYSHGAIAIAQQLLQQDIDMFAVSTIDEAIQLRENYKDCMILILSYTVPARFHELVQYRLTQTVFSFEYANRLENYLISANERLDVHLMIDTGMHREGILYDESVQNLESIMQLYLSDHLHVTGIYTHFSSADSRNIDHIAYTRKQHALFQSLLQQLEEHDIFPGITHAQSTPAVLQYPDLQYDYVRIGTLLFGIPYGDISKLPISDIVSPLYSLKAKVIQVKELSKDKCISYGNNYTTTSPTITAVVSMGYGDGYPRALSTQNPQVLLHGQYAPVIGEICMDQLIIDITNIPNVAEGDIVTLISSDDNYPELSLDTIATSTNCLKHELMTKIGPRVQRIYLDGANEA